MTGATPARDRVLHPAGHAAEETAFNQPGPGDEPLPESDGFLGMGRSQTFPFPQWRGDDPCRTVYFDQGRGRTLVFVHGLGGNATNWEPVVRHLARGFRVVGLDLVGFGWSAKPQCDYSIDLLTDHLLSFLDRRGIGQATLIGHSMGGAVCLSAALRRPGQVDGLVLVCAAGLAAVPRWMRLAGPIFLRRRLLYHALHGGAELILKNVFVQSPEENPHVRWFWQSSLKDAPGNPNLMEFARVSESLCRDVIRLDFTAQLSSLHMPVLALCGDHDRLTARSAVLRNMGRIRRVRTVVLRDCSHMPMVEYPEQTLFHLERFLHSPP